MLFAFRRGVKGRGAPGAGSTATGVAVDIAQPLSYGLAIVTHRRGFPQRVSWAWAAAVGGAVLVAAAVVWALPRPGDPVGAGAPTAPSAIAGGPSASATVSTPTSAGAPASGPATASPPPDPTAATPTHFSTVGAGRTLPSGAQCAAWVRARPEPENKRVNAAHNARTGGGVSASLFAGSDPRAGQRLAGRIDGDFTGSTHDILRWASCKWGFDEDLMKAQAAIESWWRQTTMGDFGTDAARCPADHGPGVDGRAGECPESYGLMQVRFPYYGASFPGVMRSSAMNVDVAFAVLRSCFDGYETWLNTVERGRDYAAGDLIGCMGRWFSGRWYTSAADDYIARVQDYRRQRIWETANFQE
jgi:autotransporter family porin